MASALEVARYILYTAYKYGDVITNLKLQKLLYYVQAEYLVKTGGRVLFFEPIEAWQFGPVVSDVYEKYKNYGRNPIDDKDLYDEDPRCFELTEEEKAIIERALGKYMGVSAYELVESIHSDAPWKDAYSPDKHNRISLSSMYKFYKALALEKEQLLAELEQ